MKQEKYTQEEVNATLWRACDTFRGKIDSSIYNIMHVVVKTIFLKFIELKKLTFIDIFIIILDLEFPI